MRTTRWSTAPLLVLLATACSTEPAVCTPDEAGFEADVRPRIERYCGTCHGATTDFGAPVTLLDHDALHATRSDGTRLVDRLASRIVDGSMPPVGMPRIPQEDAEAIVQWATCGAEHAPPPSGLVASAPPFLAPDAPPPGLETLELVATGHPVPPDTVDAYHCFVLDVDLDGDRFVRRFEMVVGESRVLHHLILARDAEHATSPGDFACDGGGGMPAGAQYLYAWAPGQSALQFPEGGLRVSDGDRFVLQIHYNNGAAVPDVVDTSGVRLYLDAPEGTEYGMMAVGPMDFVLPPRARTSVHGRCVIDAPTSVLAGMSHMHRLGSAQSQVIVRGDGTRTPLLELTGWRFESQLFYSTPVTLAPGDAIETTCTYENTLPESVRFGERSDDEMCDAFLYVTPPPALPYCDEGNPDRPTDVEYVLGECVDPATPFDDVVVVRGAWERIDEPPPLASGTLVPGRWVLESAHVYGTGGATPLGAIDFDASYQLARGQVITTAGAMTIDVSTDDVVILDSGTRFGGISHRSFTVPIDASGVPVPGSTTCPAGGSQDFSWEVDGDVLTIGTTRTELPGQTLWPRMIFRRRP